MVENEKYQIKDKEAPAKTKFSDQETPGKTRLQDREDTVRTIEDKPSHQENDEGHNPSSEGV